MFFYRLLYGNESVLAEKYKNYIHQLCAGTGCRLEDLPKAMANTDRWCVRERKREREREKEREREREKESQRNALMMMMIEKSSEDQSIARQKAAQSAGTVEYTDRISAER